MLQFWLLLQHCLFSISQYIALCTIAHDVLGPLNLICSCPTDLTAVPLASFLAGLNEVEIRALHARKTKPGIEPEFDTMALELSRLKIRKVDVTGI